jgi:hypothetical protein
LGGYLADQIGFDIANNNLIFKEDDDYDRLEGNGYFDEHYPYRHEEDKDFIDGFNYCSVILVRSKEVKSISAYIYKNKTNNGFSTHKVLLQCNDELYERISKKNHDGNLIQVSIKLMSIVDHDDYDKVAKAEIEQVVIDNNGNSFESSLIEKEIDDIKNHLRKKNCIGKYGQVADICTEFAESFRYISDRKSKHDSMDEINSLLSSFRYYFHSELTSKESEFIKTLKGKYDFNFHQYDIDFEIEFAKITDEKELNQAINIFNHLWTLRKADEIFKDGFPFDVVVAESLADEYLRIKNVHSKTCEKILLDLLIASKIANYANNLQIHNQISSAALLSIPIGFYKADSLVVTNERGFFSKSKFGSLIFGQLFGLLLGGFFSWSFSGWISGSNETARIILFGSLFSAYLILVGLLHQNEKVDSSQEERYFGIIRNMCNLHSISNSLDVKLMRHMINQLTSSGVLIQYQVLQIISSIESRK